MKADEYEKIIDLLKSPDSFSEGIVMLSDKLKADETEFNSVKNSNDVLRETNARLALRITESVNVTEDTEPSNEDLYSNFMSKLEDTYKVKEGGN